MNQEKLVKKLVAKAKVKMLKFHELIRIPLKAEYWEDILDQSLQDIGDESIWYRFRHTLSVDIESKFFGKISCKGGILTKKGLKFSGFRTTKYKTLEEKLKFLKIKKDDCYFCLTKNSNKNWDDTYKLIIFDSKLLNDNGRIFNIKNWSVINSGWEYQSKNFKLQILSGTSDQLWYSIKPEKLPYPHVIDINVK